VVAGNEVVGTDVLADRAAGEGWAVGATLLTWAVCAKLRLGIMFCITHWSVMLFGSVV
jgi:hypothetical protein